MGANQTSHDLRSELYHVFPSLLPKTDDIDEYTVLSEMLLDKLFQVKLDSLARTVSNEEKDRLVKWAVSHPATLPPPFSVGIARLHPFDLEFKVQGQLSKLVTIYVHSLSQGVVFFLSKKRERRTKRSLYLKRKEVGFALDDTISQVIAESETTFTFSAAYRPSWVREDYVRNIPIVIEYFLNKRGPFRTTIPFTPASS